MLKAETNYMLFRLGSVLFLIVLVTGIKKVKSRSEVIQIGRKLSSTSFLGCCIITIYVYQGHELLFKCGKFISRYLNKDNL